MERYVMIEEISDGKLYGADDKVRVNANGCKGCSYCCESMCDTIVLDPYDIYSLCRGLQKSFAELLGEEYIEIGLHDLLTLPNIKDGGKGCRFLSEAKRCTVHSFRPGICRLFPLGRYYHDDGFSYILQTHECRIEERSEERVRDWLEIEDLERYEEYVLKWHDLTKQIKQFMKEPNEGAMKRKINVMMLEIFFNTPYEREKDFYEQINERFGKWQAL